MSILLSLSLYVPGVSDERGKRWDKLNIGKKKKKKKKKKRVLQMLQSVFN
jgi:hypothetical protein